jgi:hypothetical protein
MQVLTKTVAPITLIRSVIVALRIKKQEADGKGKTI